MVFPKLGHGALTPYSRYYLIRTSRLFGNMGSSGNVKKSFVDKMIELSSNNKELKVINAEYSCPTYAHDLAQKTREIIEDKAPSGIYHVSNEEACTWYDFAKQAFQLKDIDVNIIPVSSKEFPRPARRPENSELINTKLFKMRTWQDALEDYLNK